MKLVKGSELPEPLKKEVLAAYPYRWTNENKQRACRYMSQAFKPNTNMPSKPTITDAEWLSSHAFYVTRTGRLSSKHQHCEPAFMAD